MSWEQDSLRIKRSSAPRSTTYPADAPSRMLAYCEPLLLRLCHEGCHILLRYRNSTYRIGKCAAQACLGITSSGWYDHDVRNCLATAVTRKG